jgi:hypothetical protein
MTEPTRELTTAEVDLLTACHDPRATAAHRLLVVDTIEKLVNTATNRVELLIVLAELARLTADTRDALVTDVINAYAGAWPTNLGHSLVAASGLHPDTVDRMLDQAATAWVHDHHADINIDVHPGRTTP